MSNLNENLEKIKDVAKETTQKVQENDTVNKIKESASDMAQKIKENETVANVTDKINQNEYVKKINNSKYAKLIKFGAIALAVILVFSIFGGLFGDKNAKKAEEKVISEYTEMLEDYGAKNVKVKTKLIAKNKEANMYCFDTTASCKYEGNKRKQSSFIVAYSDGEETYLVVQYEYEKENKSIKKELAFSALSKG